MRIACPHCQATYRVADIVPGTILVCHRCHTEFAAETPEAKATEAVVSDEQLHLFGQQSNVTHTTPAETTATGIDAVAPTRGNARIWPWLFTTLLLVAVSGFMVQKDAWLDNPWLRSTLINLGLPLEVRNKDWLVQPDSVQAQWIKRNDGSRVLVIEGRLTNQLSCELPLPKLVLDFYSDDAPNTIARTEVMEIRLPPSGMSAIRKAPYKRPPVDHVPVAARSDRGFMLVLDSLPPRIADFTLGVQAIQP